MPKYEAPRRPSHHPRRAAPHGRFHGVEWATTRRSPAIYREINPRAYGNTLAEFAQKFAQVPLAYQPGTRRIYSNAVDVQAYLVQKISGVPFDKFLELHIFKPLAMTSTRFTILPTDPDCAQLAAMYTRNDDGSFTRQTDEEAYEFNGGDRPSSRATSGWCPPSMIT